MQDFRSYFFCLYSITVFFLYQVLDIVIFFFNNFETTSFHIDVSDGVSNDVNEAKSVL